MLLTGWLQKQSFPTCALDLSTWIYSFHLFLYSKILSGWYSRKTYQSIAVLYFLEIMSQSNKEYNVIVCGITYLIKFTIQFESIYSTYRYCFFSVSVVIFSNISAFQPLLSKQYVKNPTIKFSQLNMRNLTVKLWRNLFLTHFPLNAFQIQENSST